VAGIPRAPATSPGRGGGGGGGGNGWAGGEAGSYPPFDVGLLRAYVEHWFQSGMLVRLALLQPDAASPEFGALSGGFDDADEGSMRAERARLLAQLAVLDSALPPSKSPSPSPSPSPPPSARAAPAGCAAAGCAAAGGAAAGGAARASDAELRGVEQYLDSIEGGAAELAAAQHAVLAYSASLTLAVGSALAVKGGGGGGGAGAERAVAALRERVSALAAEFREELGLDA